MFTPDDVVARGALLAEADRMAVERPALWRVLAAHDGPVADDALSRTLGGKVLVDAQSGARSYALPSGRTIPGPLVVGAAVVVAVVVLSAVLR